MKILSGFPINKPSTQQTFNCLLTPDRIIDRTYKYPSTTQADSSERTLRVSFRGYFFWVLKGPQGKPAPILTDRQMLLGFWPTKHLMADLSRQLRILPAVNLPSLQKKAFICAALCPQDRVTANAPLDVDSKYCKYNQETRHLPWLCGFLHRDPYIIHLNIAL